MTTNLPFARWSEVFLDPLAAAAVIDRVVHHATVLQDHRRQLQVGGCEAELGADNRQEGEAGVDVVRSCSRFGAAHGLPPLIVALLTFAAVVSAVAVAAANGTAAGTGIVQLPPEILVDRRLVRAERLLGAGDPAAALEAMNEILALQEEHDLLLPDDFDFQYAQVAYAAGRTQTAIASLNEYLVAAGREGEFYREALELLDSAEARLEREEAERRRIRRRAEAERRRAARWPPGHVFRDCETCPEMVVLPESIVALGRYEVTVGEYRAFASATRGGAGGGCLTNREGADSWRNPGFPQTDHHPVT